MNSPKSTFHNALSASAQTAVTTVAGLLYFGFLMRVLGPEVLGGWLAWLALGMVACLADLGLRESLVRRIAVADADGDTALSIELVDTTVLMVAASMMLALALLLVAGPRLLNLGPAGSADPLLVAGVAAMVWLQRVADAHAAALEGLQRYDIAARNNVIGAILGLATLVVVVPAFGVEAASLGLIVQYATSGVAHVRALSHRLPRLRPWPTRWRASLAREGLGFGLSVQAAVGSFLLIESTTKLLLARADALTLLAYYDLAFRVGRGLRNLLVAGNRVLVPRMAQWQAEFRAGALQPVEKLYLRSFRLLLLLSLLVFALALAASGLVSLATRGSVEPMFLVVFALTLPGWFVFCAVDPVINVAMGTGRMRLVVLAHVAMLLMLVLLVWLQPLVSAQLPASLEGLAVLAAALGAIAVPCVGLLLYHHRSEGVPLATLSPLRSLTVVTAAWALATAVPWVGGLLWQQALAWLVAAALLVPLISQLPAWTTLRASWREFLQQREAAS